MFQLRGRTGMSSDRLAYMGGLLSVLHGSTLYARAQPDEKVLRGRFALELRKKLEGGTGMNFLVSCCCETKRCSSFFDFCLLIPVDMTGLGHTTLSIPHLVRSGQSSSVGRG